jgi:hypothetical protein
LYDHVSVQGVAPGVLFTVIEASPPGDAQVADAA